MSFTRHWFGLIVVSISMLCLGLPVRAQATVAIDQAFSRSYWRNDGMRSLGLLESAAFEHDGRLVQYFEKAHPEAPALSSTQIAHMRAIYGTILTPHRGSGWAMTMRQQGNDSNCDFIAAANGIQTIGGNGDEAYWRTRALVAQGPLDYREGFYTLLGPNGSDQPFSLDNLGAAPEAFIGVYEALGYNATLLAAPPDVVNISFAQAIRDQLAAEPGKMFVHLWITPRNYNPRARVLTLAQTDEQMPLLYPYHEVAAIADPQNPDQLIFLDGLIGYPVAHSLERVAYLLRGFNKVILVGHSGPATNDHLRAQIVATYQPFAVVGLGGAFLSMARQTWGTTYGAWGRVIGPPLRMHNGAEWVVRLPGEYVLYERGAAGVGLAALGVWMRDELLARNLLSPEQQGPAELQNALRAWAEAEYGSLERFHQIYGALITGEFWIDEVTLRTVVLRGNEHSVAHGATNGYIAVLTERTMLVWSLEQGTMMVPLGSAFYTVLRTSLGE